MNWEKKEADALNVMATIRKALHREMNSDDEAKTMPASRRAAPELQLQLLMTSEL